MLIEFFLTQRDAEVRAEGRRGFGGRVLVGCGVSGCDIGLFIAHLKLKIYL